MIPIGLGRRRTEIDRLAELMHCFVYPARRSQSDPEVVVHVGGSRLAPDRTLEMAGGRRRVAVVKEQICEVVMRGSELRLQLERLLIALCGPIDPLLLAERHPEIAVCRRVIRLRIDCAAVV